MYEHLSSHEIDPVFSLVRDAKFHDAVDSAGRRFLSAPADNEQLSLHMRLRDAGVSLFAVEVDEENMRFHIPKGTQPLEQLGIAVRRNAAGYSAIFHQVGQLMSRLHKMGYELSSEAGTISSQTALVFSALAERENDIVLVPPYRVIEASHSAAEVVGITAADLAATMAQPADAVIVEQEVQRGFYELT